MGGLDNGYAYKRKWNRECDNDVARREPEEIQADMRHIGLHKFVDEPNHF